MGKINIIGNTNPEIGTLQQYSIFKGFEVSTIQSPAFEIHQDVAHWEIYVLERGVWRKTDGNAKTGEKVSYTFNQKSLTRKGIKIIVTKDNEKAELIIKTKPSGNPKINKIELLDVNGQKLNKALSYVDTLTAKAYCTDMENQVLCFTLWEDDAKGIGHNTINQVNKINLIPQKATVKNGVAKVRFNMAQYFFASKIANMHTAKGDKNEGSTHEYYVTAEYYGKLEASNNVNLKNPYNPNSASENISHGTKTVPANSSKKPVPNKRPKQLKPAPKKETFKMPITQGAKTKAADSHGKIISAEFVDLVGRPYIHMKFGTSIKVRIVAKNMKGKRITLRIWEDDISDQQVFEKDYVLVADVNEVIIPLTEDLRRKGDDWKEGSEQEYFLEIEYAGQSINSDVVKVNDSAPMVKLETGKSMHSVGKGEKEEKKKDGKCPNCEKDITADDLKTIFPNADITKRKIVADTYSKYMKELNMNTCWNKAHFFAQARIEAGLALNMKNGENFNYYYGGLSIFRAFQTIEGKEKAKLLGRPTKLPKFPGVNEVNQIKIANYAYSPPAEKAKELENTEPNDGWNYRGRGLIQVTGKGFYKYCNNYTKKGGYDIIANPDLLGDKIELAVLASMVFFKWKGINGIANGTKNVKGKICPEVGADVVVAGKSNYDEKQKAFNDITSKIYKVDECRWGKVADVPVKSSNESVLEEMKKLVDQHIPYSQSGTRNELTEEGLENLDCSETVGIYLYKLGIMPNYKAIDTSTMTTEDNLRKTIGTNNIDLVSGSDEKDFKPQRGDVFVWRKGAAGPGHTGIVYKYDEATDIVTILEAIGNVGAVSESDQVKNGGYSKAGCSRTAKYNRLKGALYGHKGWAGYFRPKNYIKKL